MGVVNPTVLRELVDAGVVTGVIISLADSGQGLVATVQVGEGERIFGVARGGDVRYFTSIDGCVSALQDCGINRFQLDATGWVSRGKRASAARGFGHHAQDE